MFCHKCGTQIEEGAAFCHKCGAKAVYEDAGPKSLDAMEGDIPFQESDFSGEQGCENSHQIPEEEPSESQEWWDNCSMIKKTFVILGVLLIVGVVLYLLISFWDVLWSALVIIGIIGALFMGTQEERKETRRQFLGLIISVIILCVVVSHWNEISNVIQPGAGVRNAYLSQYSETVTIEEAFSGFFENEKWSTYKEDGYSYVAFTGTCEYSGKKADAKVTFKITGENFVVEGLDLNGTPQNDLILYGLLTKVYETYEG